MKNNTLPAAKACILRINDGGNELGTSKPLSFKLISLHAMLNSLMFIFPSESVSDNPLQSYIIFSIYPN